MFDLSEIDFPYPIDQTSQMGALIVHINYQLYTRGQALYWFRSKKSQQFNTCIRAGIFEIGNKPESIFDKTCVALLVQWRWVWCPKVGKSNRCPQYISLLHAWQTYSGDKSEIVSPEAYII